MRIITSYTERDQVQVMRLIIPTKINANLILYSKNQWVASRGIKSLILYEIFMQY